MDLARTLRNTARQSIQYLQKELRLEESSGLQNVPTLTAAMKGKLIAAQQEAASIFDSRPSMYGSNAGLYGSGRVVMAGAAGQDQQVNAVSLAPVLSAEQTSQQLYRLVPVEKDASGSPRNVDPSEPLFELAVSRGETGSAPLPQLPVQPPVIRGLYGSSSGNVAGADFGQGHLLTTTARTNMSHASGLVTGLQYSSGAGLYGSNSANLYGSTGPGLYGSNGAGLYGGVGSRMHGSSGARGNLYSTVESANYNTTVVGGQHYGMGAEQMQSWGTGMPMGWTVSRP